MSVHHLTDDELFREAAHAARQARYWRANAARVDGPQARQYQGYARQYETRVLNLSIVAEVRCEHEAQTKS